MTHLRHKVKHFTLFPNAFTKTSHGRKISKGKTINQHYGEKKDYVFNIVILSTLHDIYQSSPTAFPLFFFFVVVGENKWHKMVQISDQH